MGYSIDHKRLWALARRQHGVVTRQQLLEFGLSAQSIKHRVARGRLHSVVRGVFAVGRPELTQHGRWMAAVLSCGPEAALSHDDAGALLGIRRRRSGAIEVSIPFGAPRRRPGIIVHRRRNLTADDITVRNGIPVTTPVCTLIDLATRLEKGQLEAAINEADKRDLIDFELFPSVLNKLAPRPGLGVLRKTLDRSTFTLTDSELERRFLPIARKAGLPPPETQRYVNGFRVDFYWSDLGLVVETDGLRYHRTPAQQARDRRRDQAHSAIGLTALRFTHDQVRFEPDQVRETLSSVIHHRK
jgi:very-short-patch-repair endonuclease